MNLLHQSGLEKKKLWNMIRKYRIRFLIENLKTFYTETCFKNPKNVLLNNAYYLAGNFKAIKKALKIEVVSNIWESLPEESFKTGAEMFLYLNMCPKFMHDWTQLYLDLIQNASPQMIVQSLNTVMKMGNLRGDKHIVNIAEKIFQKISYIFSLEFETVDKLTKDNIESSNKSIDVGTQNIGKCYVKINYQIQLIRHFINT